MVIQTGDSTHHQDQSITLHSLRTMKATCSNPVNEIPLALLLSLSLILFPLAVHCTFKYSCFSVPSDTPVQFALRHSETFFFYHLEVVALVTYHSRHPLSSPRFSASAFVRSHASIQMCLADEQYGLHGHLDTSLPSFVP